jgi:hypothetical protein
MNKPRLNLILFLIVLAVFVVGILTYVSILGENHKINRVINNYFNTLKDGMYLEACASYSSHFQQNQLASEEERIHFNFLLELTLLKYYDLIDHYDYKLELKRSHFWIPFVGDDSVRVSVALRKKEDKGVTDILPRGHSSEPICDFIIMGREKGLWQIRQFAIADSSIAGIYNDVRQSIDINTYIHKTADGFRLKDFDINFQTLTPIDKRLLRFSLYRIQKSLDPPDKEGKGVSSTYPSL